MVPNDFESISTVKSQAFEAAYEERHRMFYDVLTCGVAFERHEMVMVFETAWSRDLRSLGVSLVEIS